MWLFNLAALQERFPRLGHLLTDFTDYRYRMMVPRDQRATIMMDLAQEQTWGNFKKEVARFY
jgi:hypothetical protein